MPARLAPVLRVSAVVVFAAACGEESRDHPLAPPAFSHSGPHLISGNVLGPDGNTICNFIPAGSTFLVRVINPVNAPVIAGAENLTCSDNSFLIAVPPGTYRLQVRLPADPGIGALPRRHLEPGDVVVNGGDVAQNIQVLNGTPMGGSVTLEGSPFEGAQLTLVYDFPQGLVAALGVSGSDGAWDDTDDGFVPFRSPMTVQSGVRYRTQGGCTLLGTRELAGFPAGAFLFPTEVAALNCTLETAPNVAFSHERTRLVVTPMPGDIGGQSPELFSQFGQGWGVQFPASTPSHFGPTHLFNGGLVIGISPDRILTGVNVNGLIDCGAACRDLGLDGTVSVARGEDGDDARTRVTWRYSDAPSPDRVGFSVVQRSFDGKRQADYVLFQFTFKNTGSARITFFAGFVGDWDVDATALNDIGFTELNRRLMYVTNDGEVGTHAGTLLLGQPISGNFHFSGPSPPALTQANAVGALRGSLTQLTIGAGQDNRYIHGAGPITLRPNRTADLWIAIVAGETKAQLLANAAAARRDVEERRD